MLFKVVFLFFDKLRVVSTVEPQFLYDLSDREVEEQVNLHLACKWFAGLGPEERAPDHSTLCRFRPDGELWVLTRQSILSRARPPYLYWTHESASTGTIGGPAMIQIGNDLFAGGRYSELPDKDGKGQSVTSVWKYDQGTGRFERIADLPEAAHTDTGYPGFVATEEGVYIVYYSGHAYGDDEAYAVKADIYLAKLDIGRGDIRP